MQIKSSSIASVVSAKAGSCIVSEREETIYIQQAISFHRALSFTYVILILSFSPSPSTGVLRNTTQFPHPVKTHTHYIMSVFDNHLPEIVECVVRPRTKSVLLSCLMSASVND